ncbi:MAG: desulfoferrodoxin family protein [Campylobacterales bacterium]|nr:desulfoferrodoxin family protein [Campylobacterales bacterium]
MATLNSYVNIDEVEREAKKDYIDRHSPFVYCQDSGTKGEKFPVKVVVGKEYTHPDDFDHYIAEVKLFDGETQIAGSCHFAGQNGGQGEKGNLEVVFNVVPQKNMKLRALAYCTKHGIWQSDEVKVAVA